MIFAVPWALVGLLALPAIWWLHRRLARLPRRDLPSLLFFVEEPGPVLHAARRRRDLELVLALVAATFLSLAAAAPEVPSGAHGRLVRVVVSGGAPAAQRGYDERVRGEIDRVRAALAPADRLEVVAWPGDGERPLREGPRPSPSALAGAARVGEPGLAIVISDILPTEPPTDVHWVAIGDPGIRNVGIVAADAEPAGEGFRALVTILNHGHAPVSLALELGDTALPLTLGPDEVRSVLHALPRGKTLVRASVEAADRAAGNALSEDDEVRFDTDPPRWRIDSTLPAGHLAEARAALSAVQGETVPTAREGQGRNPPWIAAMPPDALPDRFPPQSDSVALKVAAIAGKGLLLTVARPGQAGVRAPPGQDSMGDAVDWVSADLSLAGIELFYAEPPPSWLKPGRELGKSAMAVLIWREVDGRTWPVLVQLFETLWLVPDITRGSPPLASTPFWPLLVENLVRGFGARDVGLYGVGRESLLDPASTRLGRESRPFDPTWLLAARADRGPPPRRLGPWLAGAGVLALLALWLVGAGRAPAKAPAPRPLVANG